ncbi:hypothetical protein PIB30_079258, partial [Stylosanthes scabra]|nr:hypothetical protein [Stylosanthes scabra]
APSPFFYLWCWFERISSQPTPHTSFLSRLSPYALLLRVIAAASLRVACQSTEATTTTTSLLAMNEEREITVGLWSL